MEFLSSLAHWDYLYLFFQMTFKRVVQNLTGWLQHVKISINSMRIYVLLYFRLHTNDIYYYLKKESVFQGGTVYQNETTKNLVQVYTYYRYYKTVMLKPQRAKIDVLITIINEPSRSVLRYFSQCTTTYLCTCRHACMLNRRVYRCRIYTTHIHKYIQYMQNIHTRTYSYSNYRNSHIQCNDRSVDTYHRITNNYMQPDTSKLVRALEQNNTNILFTYLRTITANNLIFSLLWFILCMPVKAVDAPFLPINLLYDRTQLTFPTFFLRNISFMEHKYKRKSLNIIK